MDGGGDSTHSAVTGSFKVGFNPSMQRIDEIAQPVYRSLVSCVDVR